MTNEEMAVKLAETEARSKSNTHRIDQLGEQFTAINRLAVAVEVMATKQDSQAEKIDEMKDTVAKLDKKVESLEQEPGKRWKSVIEKVVSVLVAAVVGFILARVGL